MPLSEADLDHQLTAVAAHLDAQSPALDGPTLRAGPADPARDPWPQPRLRPRERRPGPSGRRRYLAATAAVVAGLIGVGLLVLVAGDRGRTTAGPAQPGPDAVGASVTTTQPAPTTTAAAAVTPLENRLPENVAAAELGSPGARLLPPTAAGWEILGATEILNAPDEATALPAGVRHQLLTLASDDGASTIGVLAVTFASAADRDALLAAEPTPLGDGNPIELAGLTGSWIRMAVTPLGPESDDVSLTNVRLALDDGVSLLDVAGVDVELADLELLIAGLSPGDDGTIETTTVPAGYGRLLVTEGLGPVALAELAPAVSLLELVLVDPSTGAEVAVTITADRAPQLAALGLLAASTDGPTGSGWYNRTVFGEAFAVWTTPAGAVVQLTSHDGRLDGPSLLALAETFEQVDATTWEARLATAQWLVVAPSWDPAETIGNERTNLGAED